MVTPHPHFTSQSGSYCPPFPSRATKSACVQSPFFHSDPTIHRFSNTLPLSLNCLLYHGGTVLFTTGTVPGCSSGTVAFIYSFIYFSIYFFISRAGGVIWEWRVSPLGECYFLIFCFVLFCFTTDSLTPKFRCMYQSMNLLHLSTWKGGHNKRSAE